MKQFKADLHIHTALSPCAMEEMTPPAIVREAGRSGLEMIAICDHNAAGNVAPTQEAAGAAIATIAGMEITTAEDIHVVGLFPSSANARAAADVVREGLPLLSDRSGKFGCQLLMNSHGWVVGTEPKMLAASSVLTLSQVISLIKNHSGLAMAAHVNRPSFSVVSQLGLFPIDAGFDAVEVFSKSPFASRLQQEVCGMPIVNSSDSHSLDEIGTCFTVFEMAEASFGELVFALKGISGRKCCNA